MTVNEMQQIVNNSHYWDERVIQLNCNYFGDEIVISYGSEEDIMELRFLSCYKYVFNHDKKYDKLKSVKDMTIAQIPYFLQDIEFSEKVEDEMVFYNCRINMYPLALDIWFKDIQIIK